MLSQGYVGVTIVIQAVPVDHLVSLEPAGYIVQFPVVGHELAGKVEL